MNSSTAKVAPSTAKVSPSAPAGSRQLATAVAPSADANSDDDEQPVGAGFATLLVGGSLAVFILLVGIGIYLLTGQGSSSVDQNASPAKPDGADAGGADRVANPTPAAAPDVHSAAQAPLPAEIKTPAPPPTPMVAPPGRRETGGCCQARRPRRVDAQINRAGI